MNKTRMVVTQPKVFVIVLTWNHLSDTLECLRSLKNLEYPSYQTVVVDNGSEDNTPGIVREKYPNVVVIENERNLGYAEGNNVGMRYALELDANYIFLLNNDAQPTPNLLSDLIQTSVIDPSIGMLCPTIVSFFDQRHEYVGACIDWKHATAAEIEKNSAGLPNILDTDYAPGCAVLVKREVVRRIGLLDPEYFAYFEDVDWSVRARRAGYRVVVVPHARVFHKGTSDHPGQKSAMALYVGWRNRALFMRKHGKSYHWPFFLRHYCRKSLEWFSALCSAGQLEHAEALVDGFWAGITGHFGNRMSQAPNWFKHLVHERLGFLLWLTGWLYFFEYEKMKFASHKSAHTSI